MSIEWIKDRQASARHVIDVAGLMEDGEAATGALVSIRNHVSGDDATAQFAPQATVVGSVVAVDLSPAGTADTEQAPGFYVGSVATDTTGGRTVHTVVILSVYDLTSLLVLPAEVRRTHRSAMGMRDEEIASLTQLEEAALRSQFAIDGTDVVTRGALRTAILIGFESFRHQLRQVAGEMMGPEIYQMQVARTGILSISWPDAVGTILAQVRPSSVPLPGIVERSRFRRRA